MKNILKRKLFVYLIFLLILSIFAAIYALLIVSNKTSGKVGSFNTITFIGGIIMFIILGLLAGNTAGKNGLLEGLISATIIILITLIINFFVKVPFVPNSFIKIICYLTGASLGGVVGVNFKSFRKSKTTFS